MKLYPYIPMMLLLAAGLIQAAEAKNPAQLQREISQLTNSLDSQQAESDAAEAEITRLEKKLGEVSQQYFQTEQAIEDTQVKLQAANTKKLKLDADLDAQRSGLAQQLQALYAAGEQSYLRLLLRQDDPSDISRTIRYLEYLNKNRVTRIQRIQKTLEDIIPLRDTIDKNQRNLQNLNKQLEQQKADIEGTLSTRSSSLTKLNGDIRTKKKQLDKLRADDITLQQFVDHIATQPSDNKNDKTPAPAPITDKPDKAATKPNPTAIPVTASFTPDKPFSSLKGGLSWPISGKIIHPFGSQRNEKQQWKGVVIAAAGGTKVKAVARGKVVFAGWMDGYGHLIILEHDNKFLSLYGYNRAVYKKEGSIVGANETIAAVGNSSGQNQDGLYFEIRQGTAPQNPARWCH